MLAELASYLELSNLPSVLISDCTMKVCCGEKSAIVCFVLESKAHFDGVCATVTTVNCTCAGMESLKSDATVPTGFDASGHLVQSQRQNIDLLFQVQQSLKYSTYDVSVRLQR